MQRGFFRSSKVFQPNDGFMLCIEMSIVEREALIRNIEKTRGSRVICLLTSLRPNVPAIIAEDMVRQIFDQLLLFRKEEKEKLPKIDVFLVSNGGSGVVPWRIVSLLREYSKELGVLIPYRAYSAASLLALGADEIVMHPFGELGPIDPTVSNEYNPKDDITRQRIGISVEDVTAYVNFIKETVGITHEDELIKAIELLADKVHPLALGNVERFISQSRMIAKKILKTHMKSDDERIIDDIIENMASKLYFHGHPINRVEAKNDLKLKIANSLPAGLEGDIWALYEDFEKEFDNKSIFDPAGDLAKDEKEMTSNKIEPLNEKKYEVLHAIVESTQLSCKFTTLRRYRLFRFITQQGVQSMIQEDILQQGWSCSPVAGA